MYSRKQDKQSLKVFRKTVRNFIYDTTRLLELADSLNDDMKTIERLESENRRLTEENGYINDEIDKNPKSDPIWEMMVENELKIDENRDKLDDLKKEEEKKKVQLETKAQVLNQFVDELRDCFVDPLNLKEPEYSDE
ncbi:hypothetical protein M9Y10_039644 [Tritrichomonas musculus]|uniref:Uncharacterized protein n=1 Tax=Tritrichomonas musculus TaxID=1915356 RepID=A0ABR2GQU5_9EUKA